MEEPTELHLYGTEITKVIGDEVRERVENAYMLAKQILEENIEKLHALAEELLRKEKINEHEFNEIMTFGKLQEIEEENI